MNKKKICCIKIAKYSIIFVILVMCNFITKCSSGEPFFYDLEIDIQKSEAESGEDIRVIVNAIHNKNLNNIKNNEKNLTLKFYTDNEYVDVDKATSRSAPFVNGISRSIVRLINRKRNPQKAHIIAKYGDIKTESKQEITIKPYIYDSERSIYPHIPEKEKITVLNNVLKKPIFGKNKLSDVILLGTDNNNNFFIYLKKPDDLVLKISSDGSLITIIIEPDFLNLIQGEVIAGTINKETRRLYLLKSDTENNLNLMFFDVSGNLRSKPVSIGKIKNIVLNYVNKKHYEYEFEAIELDMIKNKPTIVIREVLPNNKKISIARPTLIVLNDKGKVENVMLINPPKLTSYKGSYWDKTITDKLNFQLFIRQDNIYILWGSGYNQKTSIGYMIQKLSISGYEQNSFTRLITRIPVPYETESIYQLTYSKKEENNYIARNLYVDDDKNVYAFIELDNNLYIDKFSEQDIYIEQIQIETAEGIGELELKGHKSTLVYDNKVIISTNKGIYIFKQSKIEP